MSHAQDVFCGCRAREMQAPAWLDAQLFDGDLPSMEQMEQLFPIDFMRPEQLEAECAALAALGPSPDEPAETDPEP